MQSYTEKATCNSDGFFECIKCVLPANSIGISATDPKCPFVCNVGYSKSDDGLECLASWVFREKSVTTTTPTLVVNTPAPANNTFVPTIVDVPNRPKKSLILANGSNGLFSKYVFVFCLCTSVGTVLLSLQ